MVAVLPRCRRHRARGLHAGVSPVSRAGGSAVLRSVRYEESEPEVRMSAEADRREGSYRFRKRQRRSESGGAGSMGRSPRSGTSRRETPNPRGELDVGFGQIAKCEVSPEFIAHLLFPVTLLLGVAAGDDRGCRGPGRRTGVLRDHRGGKVAWIADTVGNHCEVAGRGDPLPADAATIATASALNSLVNFRRLRLDFADMDTPFWPHQAKVGVRQTGSTSGPR